MGAVAFWRLRDSMLARLTLTAAITAAACWSYVLLQRNSGGYKTLGAFVLVAGLAVAAAFAVVPWIVQLTGDKPTALVAKVTGVLAAAALLIGIAGPAAYSLQTAGVAHTGSIPSAGPATSGGTGFGGRGGPGGGGFARPTTGTGTAPGAVGGAGGFGGRGGPGGGIGGLLDASTPSAAMVTALRANASSYTWVLATVGANNAAGYQLASGEPVMAIGGFNGSDPTPTLAAFQALVQAGKVHYYIGGGGLGSGMNAAGTASQITAWVEANFATTTIGGTTVYDLTQSTTSSTSTT